MHRLLLLLLAAALAPAARAAEWIVGPGGFADLPSAYAAASPGDVIRIRASSIPSFALAGKGVVIRGDGIVPTVQPQDSRISGIPSGQVLVLEDVHIDGGLALVDCIGSVVLHRVICWSPTAYTRRAVIGLNVERCSLVQAYDSTFRACSQLATALYQPFSVGCGARIRSSRVAFRSCRIDGCDGFTIPYINGPWFSEWGAERAPALWILQASVSLSSCTTQPTATGGYGGGSPDPGFARLEPSVLLSEPTSELWIADGTGWDIENFLFQGVRIEPRLRSCGVSPRVFGFIDHFHHPLPLPSVETDWIESSQTLNVRVADRTPAEIHFLVVSFAPRYVLESYGPLLIDLDHHRSALLDVIPASAGTWTGTYRLSQAWLDALRDQPTYFQAFSLDAAGKLRCSMPDFAMR
jgi:hypothetical protein